MATASTFQPHKHPRDYKGRFAPQNRPQPPTLALTRIPDAWTDRAHPYTIVEPNGAPEGFFALCPPARGAIAFAYTAQEAITEMRCVLFDWAYLSLDLGHELPKLPALPSSVEQ